MPFAPVVARRTQPARPARFLALLAAAAVLAALFTALLAPAGRAQAASYRFWGYYQLQNGSWAYAQKGPAQTDPADGSVEGWRFALAAETTPRFPRAAPSFADICGTTTAVQGKKRVGLVIDPGRTADGGPGAAPPAPSTACAVVDTKASGAEALAAVATVRTGGSGLTCAINGYPATGCGGEVKDVPQAAQAPDTAVTIAPAAKPDTAATDKNTADTAAPSSSPQVAHAGTSAWTWVWLGIVVAALLAVGALALRRRGRA